MNLSIGWVIPEKEPPFPFSTSIEAVVKNSSPNPSASSGTSSRFFVTCWSTSPGERPLWEVFSEGGAKRENEGTEGGGAGTVFDAGADGVERFRAGTGGVGVTAASGTGTRGTAEVGPAGIAAPATVGGGTVLGTGAEPGDSSVLAPSETAPVPADGEMVSALSPKDGIDANRRRNTPATKTLFTTHPSKKPPIKQYKLLFCLMN